MAYAGYYINLDRSADRRAEMGAHLGRLGLTARYRRFAAIEGNRLGFRNSALSAGEIGCFTSHYRLLAQHPRDGRPLHVIEDDVVLARRAEQFVLWVISSGMLDDHDMLFLDMSLPTALEFHAEARQRYRNDIRRDPDGTAAQIRFSLVDFHACMASYLVNPRSIDLIRDLLAEELAAGASQPIDVFLRDKIAQGRLRARCLFPFVTSVRLDRVLASTIREDDPPRAAIGLTLLRHSFFVECDHAATLALARQLLPTPDADPHHRLFAHTLGFLSMQPLVLP